MSSASPRGRTPGQPGEYVGEYKDGLDSLPLGRGKFARFFQIRRKGVGEYEIFVKSRTVTPGISRGFIA